MESTMRRGIGLDAMRWLTFLSLLAWVALAIAAPSGPAAGRVIVAVGQIEAVGNDGATRLLKRRDAVYEGDLLTSGPRGRAQIRFTDGTLLAVRPSTELSVDEYRHTNAPTDSSAMRLRRGGIRTVTGSIARNNRSAYRFSTPLAVIGVRGTDWQAFQEDAGPLLLGVAQGGISTTTGGGDSADLGLGSDYDFARVNPDGTIDLLLLEPDVFSATPDMEESGEDSDSGDAPDDDPGAAADDAAPESVGGADSGGTVATVETDINPNIAGDGVPETEQPFGSLYSPTELDRLRNGELLGLIIDFGDGTQRRAIEGGTAALLDSGDYTILFDDTVAGIEFQAHGDRAAFFDAANNFGFVGDAPISSEMENVGGITGLYWAKVDASATSPARFFSDPNNTGLFTEITSPFLAAIGPQAQVADLSVRGLMLVEDFLAFSSDGTDVFVNGGLTYQIDLGNGLIDEGFLSVNFGGADPLGESSIGKSIFVDFTGVTRGPTVDLSVIETFAFFFDGEVFDTPVYQANLEGFLVDDGTGLGGLVLGFELVPQDDLSTDLVTGTALFRNFPSMGLTPAEEDAMDPAMGGFLFVSADAGLDGGSTLGFATDPAAVGGTANVVIGVNEDVLLDEDLDLNAIGGDAFPPNVIARLDGASVAQDVPVTQFSGVTGASLVEWAPNPPDGFAAVIDNVEGFQADIIDERFFFALARPTDVANLTGFRVYSGSSDFGLGDPGDIDAPFIGSYDIDGVEASFQSFHASFYVDFATGAITNGFLFAGTEFDAVADEEFGFGVTFAGNLMASNGFPALELDVRRATYRQIHPADVELKGFFTGTNGEAFAMSFYASAFDSEALQQVNGAGAFVIGRAVDNRINAAESLAINHAGIVVYNPMDSSGLAVDSRFAPISGFGSGMFFGRGTAGGITNPIYTAGSTKTRLFDFLASPADYTIRRNTAVTFLSVADVTLSGSPGDSFAGAGFPVSWGIWNANSPTQAVSVQNDPTNAANRVLVDRDAVFLSVVPTNVANLVGTLDYGGGGSSGFPIQFIGRGGNTAAPTVTNALADVAFRMSVDFGSGDITAGQLGVQFVDPLTASTIQFGANFTGFVAGGLADLQIGSLSITQSGSPGIGNIADSSLAGAFTGPTGQRFVGAFGLIGQGFSTDSFHAEGALIVGPCPACAP